MEQHKGSSLRVAYGAALLIVGVVTSAARAGDPGSVARHAALPAATPDPKGARPFEYPRVHADLQTLVVTTAQDVYDPADIVAPGTGRLSLREAFSLANRLDVEVTIVLEHGAVYRLERCGSFASPVNTANELVHTANRILTISGNGAIIFQDCAGAGVIVQQGGDQLLNLADVVIEGGRSTHVPAGGVWSSGVGPVRISNMVVVDNQVKLPVGAPPTVSAGGVASNGDIIISGATFARNVANIGAGAAAAVGAVKSVKSSFYANTGQSAGALQGGTVISPPPPPGPPPMIGRTPDGVTLIYSTLSENSRPQIKLAAGALTSFASVIAGRGSGPLCSPDAPAHSLGYNYASGGQGCGFGTGPADVAAGPDPKLMHTAGMKEVDVFEAEAASPLRDAIPASSCVPQELIAMIPVYSGISTDQRGVARPQGSACDIGAIESVIGSLGRSIADPPMSDLPVDTLWAPSPMEPNWFTGAIRVTTTVDELGGQQVSLRDAFSQANAADHDTIIMLDPAAVYRLEKCVPTQTARDNQSNELIHLGHHSLSIYGSGAAIVQTCEGSAVIKKYGDARLLLNGLTITGGRSVAPGGGIFSAGGGELRLEHCWITENVSNAAGGGVAAFGNVVLLNSSISNNRSFEFGGGMAVTADVTAVNSSVFDNIAGIANGGIGIHGGIITLLFSTVVHNTAPNIAAGQFTAIGSVVANFIAPAAPPGGPPEGAGHGKGFGFPPPGNCDVQSATNVGLGNYASDKSCGFNLVGADPKLVANRPNSPTHLVPSTSSPLLHALSEPICAPYRYATDQMSRLRYDSAGCDIGAVAAAGSR